MKKSAYLFLNVLFLVILSSCNAENKDIQNNSQAAAQEHSQNEQNTDMQPEIYEGTGVVISIPPSKRHVIVRHGEIPGFMNAMTMPINVKDSILLQTVSPQDSIWFEIERIGNNAAIQKLEVIPLGQTDKTSSVFGRLPDHEFKLHGGESVQMSDFRGQVLLVNFWATWCGPCRREIPELVRLKEEYGSKGFEILGISVDEEGFEIVNPFLNDYDINYPIVIDDYTYGNKLGGVYMIPTTYLIDREGNIIFRKIGEIKVKEILPKIEPILQSL